MARAVWLGVLLMGPLAAQEAKDRLGDPLPAGAAQRLGTLRLRYGGVGGLAYLPDGRGVILTGGSVELWDLAVGQRLSSTKVSGAGLVGVQVRSDGRALLLADAAGMIREWDPLTLAEVRAWDTGQKQLRTACYSPDGTRVLTAANAPPGLKEWDLATGRELVSLRSELVVVRAGAIYGPGHTAILGGGYQHNLEHWDLGTGRLLKRWCAIYEAKHLALAPDGQSVTVGLEDRALEWSLATYTVLNTYKHCPGEAARIFQVAYLPAANEVLCGGRDGSLHRWSRTTGERVFSWRPHQSLVAPFAVSPDHQWVLSYGTGRVAETNLATGEPRLAWDRHAGSVEAVAVVPGGGLVVTGSSDETLRVWDSASGDCLRVIRGAALGAYAVAVSAGGRLAAGCKDGVVREYRLTDGTPTAEYRGHRGYVRAVCFADELLVSSADDGSIRLWRAGRPEAGAVLEGHRGGVLGLGVSPDGRQLASCGRDGTVRLWDLAARREVRRFTGHGGWVTAVRFTPDGGQLVSGGRDGRIVLTPLSGDGAKAVARGSWVNALACAGETVLAAGADGLVLGYDLRSGAPAGSCRGQGGSVLALAADGRWLVTGSQDTTALVWPLPLPATTGGPALTAVAPAPAELLTWPDHDSYGCEDNPTGDPIGGGPGYRDVKTGGERVVRTRPELLEALKSATAGEVVFVPDGVDIDLTGAVGLNLPAGVTLAGTRGLNGSPGARLYTTLRSTNPLFRTAGDGVRVTGLRIEGPYAGPELIAEFAQGLSIGHHGGEVDNCEIYNWNCVGIGVGGGGDVRIHHNHIHHCQLSGYGYGVVTGRSNCFIIANRFDWCRHDIASSGSPGDAYEAAWNLVGEHATSHRFDMHGGSDRGDGTDLAGDWIRIHHNTFLDGQRRAVVIRGVPSQGADIHHNRLAQPTGQQAVSSPGNTRVHHNRCGPEGRLEE